MKQADSKGRTGGPDPGAGNAPGAEPQGAAPSAASGAPDRAAPMDIQAYIGTRLREVYEDVAKQPIPDRFLELMRQLDAK